MPTRRLATLLFSINGIEAGRFSFRFLAIREPIPIDNALPVRMQRWADRLWRVELKAPVHPAEHEGRRGFLVPAEVLNRPNMPKTVVLRDVPDCEYTLEATDHTREITIQQASHAERDLICRMLERPFTDVLLTKQEHFWRAEWTLFFSLRAVNEHLSADILNAYRGFKFGVVLVGSKPFLAIDVRTRYIGRRPLSDYTTDDRASILADHLDLTLREEHRPSFLRDNGPVKIPCHYAGETGKRAADFEFQPGTTVASYYKQRYGIELDSQDLVVFAKDRKADQDPRPVPASRLFPVFTTEFSGVKSCSAKPWMSPEERRYETTKFLEHVSGARLGDRTLIVASDIMTASRTVFLPPRLEFGSGRILNPFGGRTPDIEDESFDRQVVRWGSSKYPTLQQAGPQHNEPLPDLVIIYPDRLLRDVREIFVRDLQREILLQTGQNVSVIQWISYNSGRKEKMGGSLLRRVPEVRSIAKRCLAVVVLCDDFDKSVHGDLKDRIRPVLSQCVTERTVLNIAKQLNANRAKSQVRNLALAILTEAGVKPWVLADPLHYDVYIGIDLLYGRVAYHAFCGTGGRVISSRFGESQLRGRMQEGIKAPLLRGKIEELLREMAVAHHQMKTIVLHRDGKWCLSEGKGLRSAIASLKSEGVLASDVEWAVVEIRKNHMPVRLFTEQGKLLQNPLPGTHLMLDEKRILLTTTGKPGAWDSQGRTAGTLLLRVAESCGDFSLKFLAEDAYRLTHLNWTSPDIEISLPVTIRWADEALRETLTQPPREEEDEETSYDEEGEAVEEGRAAAAS